MKLIVDFSSVLGAYLHIKDEEFGVDVTYQGEDFHIPHTETSMERFQYTISNLAIEPKDFIVVKDPGGLPKARVKILKTYKQRPRVTCPEFGEARKELFDTATEWLKSQGAIIATPKNFTEADDLINELANRLPDSIVWTRDKDMLACDTDVFYTDKTGTELNPVKFPVPREYIHLYRTLVLGDTSDNVPSCKGFGPKAWDKMIAQFDEDSMKDLDEMLRDRSLQEHLTPLVEDFKPFQLIIDQAEDLYKSYQIMSFLPVPACEVKWEGGVKLGEDLLVTKGNYDEVMRQLKSMTFDYAVIDYEADTCQESKDWCKSSGVKVDVLGQEITGMGLRINGKNFYFSVNHADTDNITMDQLEAVLEFLWGKKLYAHNASFENTLTYSHFEALLPNMEDTMLMASYVDENDYMGLKHLTDKWLGLQQSSYETTLAGRSGMSEVSGEEVLRYGLDDVIGTDGLVNLFTVILQYEGTLDVFRRVENDSLYFATMCFINGVEFDEIAFKELKRTNDINIAESWELLSEMLLDLDWAGKDFRPLTGLNMGEVNRVYKGIHGKDLEDVTAVKMAIRMMDDRDLADMIERKDMAEINDYYQRHWKPAAEFNVRSPTQMSKLLYDVLELPVRLRNKPTANMMKAGKQGNPCSNADAVMNAIAYKDTEHVVLLETLMEHKGYLTKESLFLSKYPGYVHWKTGKIHASLRQSATTTRRDSCSNPNLLQMPKFKGREYRDMLKAKKLYSIVALDFTGQELCLAADDSRDPNFLSCYIGDNKRDPHSLTGMTIAQKVSAKAQEEIYYLQNEGEEVPDHLHDEAQYRSIDYDTFIFKLNMGIPQVKDFRTIGKKINFTCQYGAMAPKVGQTLGIPEHEAQTYITSRADTFPGLIQRVKDWHKICRKRGYATTMLGARRHLDGHQHYGSRKDYEVQAADRLAYSMRIQGSAAEMTKLARGRMYREGLFDDGSIIPAISIYDELVLQVRDDRLEEVMPKLIEIMSQQYADMIVPMSTDPEVGKNFGTLENWQTIQLAKED